jgi:glycosyltransferase involved in cell wall biosynthesis
MRLQKLRGVTYRYLALPPVSPLCGRLKAVGAMAPSVAVIMRTRDRPVLLSRAIASVCAQTFADWHLVLLNDGGDATSAGDVLRAHDAKLAGRVTVISNNQPRGRSAALNQGIKASSSTYIAIHDDDDTWHPEFLARTTAHLDATADAAVAARTEIVYERIDGAEVTELQRQVFCPDVHAFTLSDLLLHNRTVPISVLYRRAVHAEIGWYREDLPFVEDWDLWLRLTLAEQSLGFIDGDALAFWHQRPEAGGALANSMIASNAEHRRLDQLLRDEALRSYAREHGLGELLYLTSFVRHENDRLGDTLRETNRILRVQGQRLDGLEAAVKRSSLVSLTWGVSRRLKRRLRTS